MAGASHETGKEWFYSTRVGDRGGSSGSPLLYKSTESQMRSAINCCFSYFKIRE